MVRQLRRICEQADLRLIEQTGRFRVPEDPPELLAWVTDVLLGMRGTVVAENLATDEDIAALAREMDAARDTATYATGPLNVEMITEVP